MDPSRLSPTTGSSDPQMSSFSTNQSFDAEKLFYFAICPYLHCLRRHPVRSMSRQGEARTENVLAFLAYLPRKNRLSQPHRSEIRVTHVSVIAVRNLNLNASHNAFESNLIGCFDESF